MSTDISTRSDVDAIHTFEQAHAYAESMGGADDWDAISDAWPVLGDDGKRALVGQPFVIVGIAVRDGDYGEYVSLNCVTPEDKRFILNDGSSGIARQITDLLDKREAAGIPAGRPILVLNGLRQSDYYRSQDGETSRFVPDGAKKGDWTPARTFYLG